MHVQYEENTKKSLICRGCAGRTLGQDYSKCCCQENKFVNVLKNHYIDGTNINQLREMLDLTQGCENFCEEHGYLYEFILTKKSKQGESQFDHQELCCKVCMKEKITKNQLTKNQLTENQLTENQLTENQLTNYQIDLLNDQYFTILTKDSELPEKITEVFDKMKEACQNQQLLEQKIAAAEQRKNDIINNIIQQSQGKQNQNPDNDDQEQRDKKINQLNKLKNALDLRIKAIAFLENGYHDYLHDEYLEGESVRKKIMEEDNPIRTDEQGHQQQQGDQAQKYNGYSIQTAFKYFDNIQFILNNQLN